MKYLWICMLICFTSCVSFDMWNYYRPTQFASCCIFQRIIETNMMRFSLCRASLGHLDYQVLMESRYLYHSFSYFSPIHSCSWIYCSCSSNICFIYQFVLYYFRGLKAQRGIWVTPEFQEKRGELAFQACQ